MTGACDGLSDFLFEFALAVLRHGDVAVGPNLIKAIELRVELVCRQPEFFEAIDLVCDPALDGVEFVYGFE